MSRHGYPGSDLIGIREVAELFEVTAQHARRYESAGIVRRVDRKGTKHLFSKADVLWALDLWTELRNDHSIADAGRIVESARRGGVRSPDGSARAVLAREVAGSS